MCLCFPHQAASLVPVLNQTSHCPSSVHTGNHSLTSTVLSCNTHGPSLISSLQIEEKKVWVNVHTAHCRMAFLKAATAMKWEPEQNAKQVNKYKSAGRKISRKVTASGCVCLNFNNTCKSVTRNLLILLNLIDYKSSPKNSWKQLTIQTNNYFAADDKSPKNGNDGIIAL